jgi:riboflavin synthase
MFTGLVEACVPLLALEPVGSGARLLLPPPELPPDLPAWEPRTGESLSISGCCLTVVELGADGTLQFDLSAETLGLTWFADLEPGRLVNLERSVRLADRLGGHLVSGHVDGVGTIVDVVDSGDGGKLFTFEVPAALERYLLSKGSVALDGISLTVVEPRGGRFDVAIIPETLVRTSFGAAKPGERVHVEADLIGKWVEKLVAPASS